MNTSEAAGKLGISNRRVTALIASGDLHGTKRGKSWEIDEESVNKRLSSPRPAGRPKYGIKNSEYVCRYTLMNADTPVLTFVYDMSSGTVASLEETGDIAKAPIGACYQPDKPHRFALADWISERYIPENRIGIEKLLEKAGYSSTDSLMFRTLGLNLTDQFWFRPEGSEVDWHDVNFFENEYAGEKTGDGPNSGTPGMLAKWWERRNGTDYLIKEASTGGREPYAELAASALYQHILSPGDFVPYGVEVIDGSPCSVCPSFIASGEALVTMKDLMRCYGRSVEGLPTYNAYLAILESLEIENAKQQLAKMIVCDFLTANEDRHEMNLGIVQDANSGQALRVAPIFDNGRSFFFKARRKADMDHGLFHYTSHPFSEYPTTQLAYVEDYSWLDFSALDGFSDELGEIIASNEEAPAWFPQAVISQFKRQLERVREMAQERGY